MNTKAKSDDQAGPLPRYQRVQRHQREWRDFCLDEGVREDDPVRLVWAYVESLDLSRLYARIRAVEGRAGRDPIDPRLLVALWLYATIDGVGSARRISRLCERDMCYQWLCGGVGVNHHTLSDFRVAHVEIFEDLLVQGVGVLLHEGLIELNRVAQDGMRVRASAGGGSFRRRDTLERCLQDAEDQLQALREERDDQDPSAEERRHTAARERAARERAERVRKALEHLSEVEHRMEKRKKGSSRQARASTTDPEARRMKMADGGVRPALNVQFATTTGTQVIVGVQVVNVGSDSGQMAPMLEHLEQQYGRRPEEYLVDGNFATLKDIHAVEQSGTKVYAPLKTQGQGDQSPNRFARREGDTDQIAAWRERMGTHDGREIYRMRAETAEFPNAGCRNRGLHQFPVCGVLRARAVSLWHALAHNFQRTLALRAGPAAATG